MNKDVILLDTDRTAEFLGLKKNTLAVWRWSKKVNLPFVKLNGRVYYRQDDLLNFINQKTGIDASSFEVDNGMFRIREVVNESLANLEIAPCPA